LSEAKEVIIRIRRYNEQKGEYWSEYMLKVDKYTQMTEALRLIKAHQDPSISYRASCHMAVCGSCGMKINGAPKLACKTRVLEEAEKNNGMVIVEPMSYYKVVKDLVVDMEPFYEKMEKVIPRLMPSKEVEEGQVEPRLLPETQETLWRHGQCIWCGLCVSMCPVLPIDDNFLGPAAHAKAFRFIFDPRDTLTQERLKIVAESAWRCTYCYQCVQACPRDIEPAETIIKTRKETFKLKQSSPSLNLGRKHSVALKKSISETGKVEGATVFVGSYGLSKSIRDLIYQFRENPDSLANYLIRQKKVSDIESIKKIVGE
jgi:succinate dehydrogenase / fumarate reductase iron-sulfur subunit